MVDAALQRGHEEAEVHVCLLVRFVVHRPGLSMSLPDRLGCGWCPMIPSQRALTHSADPPRLLQALLLGLVMGMGNEDLKLCLGYAREWNTRAKTSLAAQVLLHAVFKAKAPEVNVFWGRANGSTLAPAHILASVCSWSLKRWCNFKPAPHLVSAIACCLPCTSDGFSHLHVLFSGDRSCWHLLASMAFWRVSSPIPSAISAVLTACCAQPSSWSTFWE